MDMKRLFVGNITSYTTKDDLKKGFSRFGEIQNIEIKQKPNLVDPKNPSFFAFITIKIDDFALNRCLNRFSEKDFNGQFLNVSLAKESFLDKLKKEREEIQNKSAQHYDNSFLGNEKSSKNNFPNKTKTKIIGNNTIGKKKTFGSDDEVFDDDAIDNQKSSGKKKLSGEQKRQLALENKNKEYENKYNLVKLALKGVDINPSKKIKFDFYESDEENQKQTTKVDLFEASDDATTEDEEGNLKAIIEEKAHLTGTAGTKLLKMQSKFNLDPRFKIDKKFMDDEENLLNCESSSNKINEEDEENNNERETQLKIMEEIVGYKLTDAVDPNRKIIPDMIRYDPKNVEHQELVESMKNNNKRISKSPEHLDKKSIKNCKPVQNVPEVSKDQFYEITDNLKSALKRRGDGFSLLSMFGRGSNDNEGENKKDDKMQDKILIETSKKIKQNLHSNVFKYDSSDSEDEEMIIKDSTTNKLLNGENIQESEKIRKEGKNITKLGVWVENFFFNDSDKRLEEGAAFYKSRSVENDPENNEEKDYSQIAEKLRKIINKKIVKTRKSKELKKGFKKKGKSKLKKQ